MPITNDYTQDQEPLGLSSDYGHLSGFQNAYKLMGERQTNQFGSGDRAGLVTSLNNVGSQFKTLFNNFVGRAPTDDELNQFFHEEAMPVLQNSAGTAAGRNDVTQYIGDTFQQAAGQTAQDQLAGQTGEAARLGDLFRTQGRAAIASTQDALLNYQQRLFEKLRPQLITSLQSQGLLNTGGLNEAVAGAQGDLAASGSEALRQQMLENENQANAISFSGAAAPYQFKLGQITGQPDALRSAGTSALDMGYKTFMNNLDYQHQLGLMTLQNKLQQDNEPGLIGRLGQSFVTGLGNGAGTSLGTSLGKWAAPPPVPLPVGG